MSDWREEAAAQQNANRKTYHPPVNGVREQPGYFARLAQARREPDRPWSIRAHGWLTTSTLADSSLNGLTE